MADNQPGIVPFQNKGLILKEDPAQLPLGAYQELTNMISVQEGNLSVRPGSQQLTSVTSFNGGTVNIVHSIAKLNGIAAPARYLGHGGDIWRSVQALPASGAGLNFTQVASGVGGSGATPYTADRWTGIRYNAGTTGTPYEYFACPGSGPNSGHPGMVKDTGSLATLQQWGITPPLIPAIPSLDAVTILPATEIISGTSRISTTVASFTGTAPGNITVTPVDMSGIQAGALLNIGGQVVVVNELVSSTQFECYMASSPSGGITSGEVLTTAPSQFTTINHSIDASFNGVASDGYSTKDVVHLAVYFSDASTLLDFRLRVLVGPLSGGNSSNYYEKAISPSSLQPQVTGTQTPSAQLSAIGPLINQGAIGPFNIPFDPAQEAKAAPLAPTAPLSQTNPVWTDIDIPKDEFLSVGLAGQSTPFSWKNVTGFSIVYTVTAGATPTVGIGSLYIRGGFGPNGFSTSLTTPLAPLSYAYCFRNTVTGFESNPSILQIPDQAVQPIRQQVAVQIQGTADPQISTTAGDSSVSIYRAGGSFTDGLYRLIGFTTNPGGGTTAIFYDTVDDTSIESAQLLEFDHDPPVTSTLPQPVIAKISAINPAYSTGSPNSSSLATITLTLPAGITDISTIFTVGSIATIHTGGASGSITVVNLEQARIFDVISPNKIKAYIQYPHTTGEYVQVDAITGSPCNLGCSAFGSIFLAGDSYNPQTLYKCRTNLPEAFPVEDIELGIIEQLNVGSPSDGIMAVTEFAGEIICLNLSSIYSVYVFSGAMQAPVRAPAQRGLIGNWAWCQAAGEIWYLSYDGIYSWSGSVSMKRSEAIDPMFQGVQIGPYIPIQLGPIPTKSYTGAQVATMAFVNNEIRLVYVDMIGNYHTLRYNTIHDRWSCDDSLDPISGLLEPITAQYLEPDTGNYLIAKAVGSGPTAYLYLADNGTSDGWVDAGNDGSPINFAANQASYTAGQPALNKQFTDVVPEIYNDGSPGTVIDIAAYYDFSATADSTDTFTIAASSGLGRHRAVPLSLQGGYGKEAYAMALRYSGSATAPVSLYSSTYHQIPLQEIQSGRAYDWDDLGYQWDKRLYQIVIEYDIPSGQTQTVVMDTITGVEGAQVVTQGVQTFTLGPPTGTFTGPTHLKASFPIGNLTIAKKVRIRPSTVGFAFKMWGYTFEPIEKLPPDVVLFTQWSNYGSDYDKYCQQICLDVDTGGIAGAVSLWADGAQVAGPFSVTTNSENRHVNLTMPPQIIGKQFQLQCSQGFGVGAKFQLYDHKLIMLPADKGPVLHSWDWDSLGYEYDKKLITVTIEYDTSATSTTVLMDTLTGINGETQNIGAFSFVLNGPGRSFQTFNFPDNTFAKMVRFHPQLDATSFKEWKYQIKKLDFPADQVLFSEYNDFGYQCEKIARNLILDINTGGVPASIALVADGTTKQTFTVTTTATDRSRVIATNSELIGRLWKLELTPGSGGQTQLFGWNLDVVREPCTVTYYDSYQADFGYNGWKWIKTFWLWYAAPSGLTVSLFTDNERLFYQFTLPAQANRDLARLYMPAAQFNSGSWVLNKSKVYRIQINSASPFKIYSGSKLEWLPVGADQRQAFQQFTLGQEQQLPIQQTQAA